MLKEMFAFWDNVNSEDIDICEKVQVGTGAEPHVGWFQAGPSTPCEDTAPSASLDHLKAWRSPQLTPRPAAKTRRRFRTRYEGGRFSFRFEEPLHRFQNMVVDKMVGKSPYLIPEGDGTPY